jgi:hypothetical protein
MADAHGISDRIAEMTAISECKQTEILMTHGCWRYGEKARDKFEAAWHRTNWKYIGLR